MIDKFGRPSWDDYFMTLALCVSQKSIDPTTKHGTIVVAQDKTVLSVGYNGPPRGCIDDNIPLTRPEKYDYIVHSEGAAIINAARHGIPLKNSIFYVTGHPCEICLGEIISVGASKVIYGPISSHCLTAESMVVIEKIMAGQKLILEEYKTPQEIPTLLQKTLEYFRYKVKI
jgi:dCMP deaminase